MAGKLSLHQKSVLIEELRQHYDVLEGRFASTQGAQCNDKIWEQIATKFNSCGTAKTAPQWKKCWINMRLNVRKRFHILTNERKRTGGGTVDPKFVLSADDKMTFNICGVDYFEGDKKTKELGFGKNLTEFEVIAEELEPLREDEDAGNFTDTNISLSKTCKLQQVQNQRGIKRKSTIPTGRMFGNCKNYVELAYEENCRTNNLLERLVEGQKNIITAIYELNAILKPQYLD